MSSVLKDIGNYKQKLLSMFLSSNEICSVLLNKEDFSEEEVADLKYSQLFPYLYSDETLTEVLSYLCFEVDIPLVPTHTIKDMKIIIWTYAHKGCMKYHKSGYSGTRVDILADMTEQLLRDSEKFGIGKLSLQSVTNFFPHVGYYGRQIIFSVPDFKIK